MVDYPYFLSHILKEGIYVGSPQPGTGMRSEEELKPVSYKAFRRYNCLPSFVYQKTYPAIFL